MNSKAEFTYMLNIFSMGSTLPGTNDTIENKAKKEKTKTKNSPAFIVQKVTSIRPGPDIVGTSLSRSLHIEKRNAKKSYP